ncbi:MAG: VOC family protein [Pseudomonadota bacterium]
MTESDPIAASPAAGDRLAHIGFVVRDIERELTRWTSAGAVVFIDPELDPVQKVYCALVGFPSALPFELVAPSGEDSPVQARLKKGGGLDHVCFFVDDIEAAFADYQARGGLPLVSPVYGVVFDRMIAFVQMRTGLVVELMKLKRENRKAADPLTVYFSSTSKS